MYEFRIFTKREKFWGIAILSAGFILLGIGLVFSAVHPKGTIMVNTPVGCMHYSNGDEVCWNFTRSNKNQERVQ
jgi:hypothetical protein